MVKARVLAVDQYCVVIDPGHLATQTFFKSELQDVPIYDEASNTSLFPLFRSFIDVRSENNVRCCSC